MNIQAALEAPRFSNTRSAGRRDDWKIFAEVRGRTHRQGTQDRSEGKYCCGKFDLGTRHDLLCIPERISVSRIAHLAGSKP